jgi:hypothetical protein
MPRGRAAKVEALNVTHAEVTGLTDSGVDVTTVVVGPGSATDHGLALYSGTTGKIVKDLGTLGTAAQVLTSNGPGADPSWQAKRGSGVSWATPKTTTSHYTPHKA